MRCKHSRGLWLVAAVALPTAGCESPASSTYEGALEVHEYRLARDTPDCSLCGGIDFVNEYVLPVLDRRELAWEEDPLPVRLRTYAGSPGTDYVGPVEMGQSVLSLRLLGHTTDGVRQFAGFAVERDSVRIYSFVVDASLAEHLIDRFFAWEDQWVLEYPGAVVVDGLDLTEALGAERTFGSGVLGGKLVYLQQTGGLIGLVWDGQPEPLLYEQVPHRGCCEYSAFNPVYYADFMRFYALRRGHWYLVEAGVPVDP